QAPRRDFEGHPRARRVFEEEVDDRLALEERRRFRRLGETSGERKEFLDLFLAQVSCGEKMSHWILRNIRSKRKFGKTLLPPFDGSMESQIQSALPRSEERGCIPHALVGASDPRSRGALTRRSPRRKADPGATFSGPKSSSGGVS